MQTVLISGGSDGLGKAIAEHLGKSYQVVILSPSKGKLKKVATQLGVDYFVCDIRDYAQCLVSVKHVVKKYGTLDCLINNAGLWIQDELDKNDVERVREVIEVNVLGLVHMTKAAIPQMKKQKSGTIININSQAGLYAKPERTVYNLTKWGLTGFSKSLQPELARYGIRVTDVHPGKMKTQMFEKLGIHKDMADALDPKYVAQIIESILKLPPEVVVPELGIKYITN